MRIDARPLDATLIDLVDCALLGASFYLTWDNRNTRIKAVYPPSRYGLDAWHSVAEWSSAILDRRQYRADTPISFAEAEAIIKKVHKLHGGKT